MEKFLGLDDISTVEVEEREAYLHPAVDEATVGRCPVPMRTIRTTKPQVGDTDLKLAQSVATSCTINAEDVRSRTRKQLQHKKHKEAYRKSLVVKGETSAVTRSRRDNRDVVKQYANWEDF